MPACPGAQTVRGRKRPEGCRHHWTVPAESQWRRRRTQAQTQCSASHGERATQCGRWPRGVAACAAEREGASVGGWRAACRHWARPYIECATCTPSPFEPSVCDKIYRICPSTCSSSPAYPEHTPDGASVSHLQVRPWSEHLCSPVEALPRRLWASGQRRPCPARPATLTAPAEAPAVLRPKPSNPSATPAMDVAALRECVKNTLDANSAIRQAAELDLRHVYTAAACRLFSRVLTSPGRRATRLH